MNKTATVRARLDPRLKAEVEEILEQLGMTASETIHLLYRQIKMRKGIPFELTVPNSVTARTLRESKRGRNVRTFESKTEFYSDLGL